MSRRERRAASRAARKHQTTVAADISQLMTEANSAYRGGRLAQAEVICKQVISCASTHAPCLNLLGVIYQASGRHRLAAKLFGKAIAVDDLDAAFHYNIACSYQDLDEEITAAKHFRTAIMLGMGHKKSVEEFVIENMTSLQYIQRVATEHWSIGKEVLLTAKDIAAIGKDVFLRCALELTLLRGVTLELFLTTLRSSLLRLVADDLLDEAQLRYNVTHLFCVLAQQCFINEYVYAQTDKESTQARELRGLLLEKISTGSDISPILLAVVAAYFPLYAIPTAKSLLDRKWPVCAADLLRQQVSEPLEEADDRPNIPTLTEIDPTSMAVMQQYNENPYPRWTINPAKIVAGNLKRWAPASDSSARCGQNILIAGCGTGEHPFSITPHYPDARILAIDISRTSLAYARRKTREEGLQNLDYAQADILKLRAIGRTFDRIEAVGVLHHLAEPKAGWRVLLSLLAPNGIMRVGLYSETGRRAVVQARALIAERGYSPTVEDIRALRQTIIRNQHNQTWEMVLNNGDFYCTSGCRDLLFNVMEHRFTIPEIAGFLEEEGLSFLGFELDTAVILKFQQQYPRADALTNLEYWMAFEASNPGTFRGMYVFTVSKSEQALD
jgi:2-polyprenyl-3-methyl-5-hydroxy-6-metoxy-1,4-benzoquinol methylase